MDLMELRRCSLLLWSFSKIGLQDLLHSVFKVSPWLFLVAVVLLVSEQASRVTRGASEASLMIVQLPTQLLRPPVHSSVLRRGVSLASLDLCFFFSARECV